ncbi:MAG: N-acetylglucosaminyldiphosphoundecaprenol N-acetyl-beta-D-mannosaminyltransferase [Anaerolineales bacterium]|nr:N-acetylglucosaminyldiphosphoundecaprenol N-acetyl-beta-D-mannosaminyltransferase [Anaerolineales bacterium]
MFELDVPHSQFTIHNSPPVLSCVEGFTIEILGVQIDNVTTDEALHHIAEFVEEGTPHHTITVNPEFVMTAQRMPAFREVINAADLRIPDGVGLLWAARRQGTPLQERVAGSDMVPLIAQQAARLGHRIFLLGAAPGVAEKAAARLVQSAPGVMIVGTHAGSPAVEEEDEIVALVRARDPDVLLVAYGAPQQDLWIARNLGRLGVAAAMGVGGAFDFLAGVARRAPLWVQRLGFEWLYRLAREPWRLRRQLDIPRFMWHVVQDQRRAKQ